MIDYLFYANCGIEHRCIAKSHDINNIMSESVFKI